MRYDSEEHVMAWKESGDYPAIHDDIFETVRTNVNAASVMDLCCGTGLLAQRMHVELGMNVVGVDSNPKSIALALDAGVLVPLVHTKITPATLPGLVQLTETRRVEAVVARRCFPELFDQSHDFGRDFLNRMHAAGVHELVLEGRVRVQNARNSLPGIEEEISLALSAGWSLKARHKNCAYMVIA